MEEERYPSNKREPSTEKDADIPSEKKFEKVTTGVVVQRKKPLSRKLKEMFVGGDAQTVGQFIIMDVIAPAIRDLVTDVISQGVERMIYGETRSSGRGRSRANHAYTNYGRYSSGGNAPPWERAGLTRRDPETRPPMGRRARATHDFDEIVLASRIEGEQVLDRMVYAVDKYGQITVGDLYEIIGIAANFADEKWGWTNLAGAGVSRTRNGYLLDLPQPEILT